MTNLRHDGLSVFPLDIAKRHLRALVLIKFQLGKVEIGYLGERDYMSSYG